MSLNVLLVHPADLPRETAREIAAFDRPALPVRGDHPVHLLRQARDHRQRIREADVIHAFGGPSLTCAIAGGARRIVYTPTRWPNRHAVAWLRAAMGYRSIDVACSSATQRQVFIAHGVPAERTHLIYPGVATDAIPAARDEALRQRLSISADERLLFAPGTIAPRAGHAMAMWGLSIAAVVDPRYRLLVHGGAPVPDEMRQRLINPHVVCDAAEIAPETSTEQLLAACDAVIFLPEGPVSPALLALAMASGRPILATPTPQIRELLRDGQTALFVDPLTSRSVAQRIEDVFADPQLTAQLGQHARAEAIQRFALPTMRQAIQRLYDAVAFGKTSGVMKTV